MFLNPMWANDVIRFRHFHFLEATSCVMILFVHVQTLPQAANGAMVFSVHAQTVRWYVC